MKITVDTVLAAAALISSWFWGTQGWVTSKKLRQLQIELAEKDVRTRRMADEAAHRAALRVEITRGPDALLVTNGGQGVASNVTISATGRDGAPDPIERSLKGLLPIKQIHPDESRTFSAFVLWEDRPVFDVVVRWTNPDGTSGELIRELHSDSHSS